MYICIIAFIYLSIDSLSSLSIAAFVYYQSIYLSLNSTLFQCRYIYIYIYIYIIYIDLHIYIYRLYIDINIYTFICLYIYLLIYICIFYVAIFVFIGQSLFRSVLLVFIHPQTQHTNP